MRAAILTRVSTEGQAVADRHSLPMQRSEMESYASRRGWPVVAVFAIPGESAWKWNVFERPQFAAVLSAARAGEFDALLVYDVSRLARNQAVLHEVRRQLRECGVQLWSVSGDYDVVADGMRAGIEGLVAEASSDDHSRRVRAAYARRHEQGLPTGDVPFGYRSEGPSSAPSVVEDEAAAVRKAFADYTTGKGYQAIASEWNAAGLQPRSKRGLLAFTPSGVQSIIENPFYAGFVTHRGERRPGAHEAILAPGVFEAAHARTRRQGTHSDATFGALMAGIVECACCAGPVWSSWFGSSRHTYYFEAAKRRGRECAQSGRRWRAAEADAEIARVVCEAELPAEWFVEARRLARRPSIVAAADRERARLEERKRRLTVAYTSGAIGDAEFANELRAVTDALASLPQSEDQVVVALNARSKLSAMAQAWEVWSPAERNRALRALFESVRMDVAGRGLAVKPAGEFAAYFGAVRALRARVHEGRCTPDRTRIPHRPSQLWIPTRELVA